MKKYEINVVNKCSYGLPKHKTAGSAGMDLYANIEKPVWIWPLFRKIIPTGIKIALQDYMYAGVFSRSGLSSKHGLIVVNGVGVVDADYRGEVKVPLVNLSWLPKRIMPGQRIAQLIISRYVRIDWNPVDKLDDTERADGGFGHTGR